MNLPVVLLTQVSFSFSHPLLPCPLTPCFVGSSCCILACQRNTSIPGSEVLDFCHADSAVLLQHCNYFQVSSLDSLIVTSALCLPGKARLFLLISSSAFNVSCQAAGTLAWLSSLAVFLHLHLHVPIGAQVGSACHRDLICLHIVPCCST